MFFTLKTKENLFLKRVTDLENEERKNQLKWQVKLGEELIDAQTREDILSARSKAEHAYHVIKMCLIFYSKIKNLIHST